jgi:hypothetical protein
MTKVLEISDETYELIKDQLTQEETIEVDSLDDFIGKKLFIRTVTYHMVGEVVKRVGKFFQLKNASWVADSGRFMNAIKDGTLDEVEPVGEAFLNIDSIVDMFPWVHKLPTSQK